MPATSPVLLKVVPADVAICANVAQPAPWQRSILYPVTPMSSADAFQLRLMLVLPPTLAARPVGALGGDESTGAGAVTVT